MTTKAPGKSFFPLRIAALLVLLVAFASIFGSDALVTPVVFSQEQQRFLQVPSCSYRRPRRQQQRQLLWLSMAKVRITTPSPEEATEMGIREWPQQVKKGEWTETCLRATTTTTTKGYSSLVRYVLEGQGSLTLTTKTTADYDDDDDSTPSSRTVPVAPGTLVEVEEGPVTLSWKCTSPDMVVLTPGFEEGGKFLAVVGVLILLAVGLIIGVV